MSRQTNHQENIENIATGNGRYIPAEEVSMFCEQVGLILSSGVALYDGIEALCNNYQQTAFAESFARINRGVQETGSLYEALKRTKAFPPYMVEMVRIGEQTGKLDQVMMSLSAYYLRESKTRRAILNAVIYPLGLLCMMAVVILVLVVKVLPIFAQVYRGLGSELSRGAVTVMDVGMNIGIGVLIAVAALIVLLLIIVLLLRTKLRQQVIQFVCVIFPPLKRIYRCMAASRFAANMSMMLSSGYPLEQSLPLIEAVFDDPGAKRKIGVCIDQMGEGKTFPEAIAKADLFDKLHNKMIQIGFLSGQTDAVMHTLAGLYDEEMDSSISRLVALIEPVMVALLTVVIGGILLSVMLPLVSIMAVIL